MPSLLKFLGSISGYVLLFMVGLLAFQAGYSLLQCIGLQLFATLLLFSKIVEIMFRASETNTAKTEAQKHD